TQPETLFVIDEAYLAFSPPAKTALAIKGNNLLIVRSMTKEYALAGLRLGYVVSHNQELIEPLTLARPAWNVTALAQAAGLAALADEAHQQRSLEKLIDARQALCDNLTILGLAPVPSSTHYFLVFLNDAPAFRLNLLKQGLLVRNCTSFGLPDYIRIATRRPPENDRLVQAIKTLRA
ncbi:MAG: aminotransferase class I/II-fold pyridoxal phosphate-dependent enzyme, partial [Anaerolineae bacterium]|nr:aminotransferase class I/II-fold pyridoxal phosphate-dependent enzyme [Anaerolineae bacterium]